MEQRHTGEDAYFAASNSEKGFYSYYSACFDAARIKRVFAIKGGPGTGKSRFMREVAEAGRRSGWRAEYVYCSSDPDSLDGVILTGHGDCLALLDATAPHVYEPKNPGVREELIDLGAFWDRERIVEHADEIRVLTRQKSEAYRRAYRYLGAEGSMLRVRRELVAPYLRRAAIQSYAEKQMREIPAGQGYAVQPALLRSVGMRGEVIFDTYFASAEQTLLLEDCYGSAQVFLETVGQLAVKKKLAIRVSHDPVYPDELDGIFLVEARRAFVVKPARLELPANARVLSLRRFTDVAGMRKIRGRLRFAERMRASMRQGALEALGEVREVHFALEQFYINAMDFAAKENFTKRFCEKLFGLQNG